MSRMNELQENLFQLLVEFDEICKEHDIDYLLAAGASLGAIRNRCFMPWDDDIDLYITRDNWNKLRYIVETEENVLPKGRSLIYKENTPYYCNPLPRYVNNNTTTMYVSQALAGKACGQHLELFIMDPMPIGEKEKEEYIKLSRVYAELLTPYFVSNKNTNLEDWEEHYKLYKQYLKKIEKEGEEKVLKELEDKLHNYPEDECDEYCMRWGIKVYRYPKKHLQQDRYALFEGKKFPVGTDTEGILRIAYGDSWMYVPETEEQISHNSISSSTRPFKEYTDRYIKKINRESVFKKFRKNKINNASVFYHRSKVKMLIAKEKVLAKSDRISKNLVDEEYLHSLLENKDYNTLNKEFNDYIKLQMDGDLRKFGIIVPISNENLKTILLSLIEQGKYFDANKLLNLHKENKELEKIEEEIIACRELSIARYDKKDEELFKSLINKYEEKYPNLLDIYRAKIWIKENNAKTKEEWEEVNNLCKVALKFYPFDGEIIATYAKAKSELGFEEEAKELYIKAINHTRNGLIWQKVEDETGISRIEIERDVINGIYNKYLLKKDNIIITKQDIELELLKELDEICEENDLKYVLFENNALNAYYNHTIKNNNRKIEVAMTQGDIERFAKIINENPNRYVEGTFNNSKYVPIYISYGNENTADFDVVSYKPNIKHGISILLHPILKPSGLNSKLKKEEKIREILNKKVENKKLWYAKIGVNLLNKAYNTSRGNSYYNKFKSNTFIDKWEDIEKYSTVIINNKKISSKSLKELEKIELDGINVALPKDTNTYFTGIFGKDFNEKMIIPENRNQFLTDTKISYKQIIKETEENLKEIKISQENILLGRLKLIIDKESVHKVWYLVEMTDKQLKFIDYFNENQDILNKDINNKEDYIKIKTELNPVIKTLKEYSKYDFTFSINPKIDQLVEKVLLKQGNKKLVEKMKKLEKKEYFIE